MRAAAVNPAASRLVGVPVGRMLMIGWGLAAVCGALAGVLVAPRLFLDPNLMGPVIIYSFAAATLGGLDSPFGAVLGGWIIGVAEALAGGYVDFIGQDLKILVPLARDPRRPAGAPARVVRLTGGGARVTRTRLAWTALLVAAVALPFFFSSYRVSQFTLVLAYAVAALGLNLLVGYSGQISLGHGAFFALGAYATAILVAKAGWPHLATLPVAAAVCFVAGFAVGIPALRLHGPYLALVTLGLAVAMPQLIKRFDGLTGGTQGLSAPPPAVPGWLDFLADDQWLYLLNLAIAIAMFVLAAGSSAGASAARCWPCATTRSRRGRTAWTSPRYKTRTFAISAAYAGVGGAMFAISIGFVAPESFGFALSFSFLAAIVVGGLGTVAGAIFGALFIEFVPVYAADVNEALAAVIYGGVLILFMYVLPTGVVGLARRLGARVRPTQEGGEHAVDVEGGAARAADGAGERVRAGR